jgi:hypothetical protein
MESGRHEQRHLLLPYSGREFHCNQETVTLEVNAPFAFIPTILSDADDFYRQSRRIGRDQIYYGHVLCVFLASPLIVAGFQRKRPLNPQNRECSRIL